MRPLVAVGNRQRTCCRVGKDQHLGQERDRVALVRQRCYNCLQITKVAGKTIDPKNSDLIPWRQKEMRSQNADRLAALTPDRGFSRTLLQSPMPCDRVTGPQGIRHPPCSCSFTMIGNFILQLRRTGHTRISARHHRSVDALPAVPQGSAPRGTDCARHVHLYPCTDRTHHPTR